MRILLLHNRIYRAFSELDPYTDERCRKFIRAAQRGRVRRTIHVGIIMLVSCSLLVGGLFAAGWSGESWFKDSRSASLIPPEMWLLIPFLVMSPLAGYLTRDLLLRRRVRWVLRTRGVCSNCRYSLVGLPVGPDCTVTCPECALQSEVDPSLGELVLDEAGLAHFRPPPPSLPSVFTPARMRILKRAAVVMAILLGIGIPALLGGYELWLRHQAATALAEKPGMEAILALIEANQPAGSEGEANAWDVLQEAIALRDGADFADDRQNPPAASEDPVYADFGCIFLENVTQEERQRDAQREAKARRLLEVYREHGVYAALDRMAAAPRAAEFMSVPPGESILEVPLPYLGKMRAFARINAARMKLSGDMGDLAEYISALESNLALARIAMHGPLLIHRSVGTSIEETAHDRLQVLLRMHPSPPWLDAVDAAITRQRVALPSGYVWEGERLYALDAAAWVFSDPRRVRWGRASPEVNMLFYNSTVSGDAPVGRLGTYAHNRDVLNERFHAIEALGALPRWQRPVSPPDPMRDSLTFSPPPADSSGLPLVRALAGSLRMALRLFDESDLRRAAYPIESALERYYAAHRAYPDSLTALVPDLLPTLPFDPWTGKPWGYHVRAHDVPSDDPRGYILYSFGTDGQDDGGRRGKAASGGNYAALRDNAAGCDFIINDWQPPEK